LYYSLIQVTVSTSNSPSTDAHAAEPYSGKHREQRPGSQSSSEGLASKYESTSTVAGLYNFMQGQPLYLHTKINTAYMHQINTGEHNKSIYFFKLTSLLSERQGNNNKRQLLCALFILSGHVTKQRCLHSKLYRRIRMVIE
jgi:hypothetical protein